MTKKHTILTAINSKYIHSNLAVYCLRAYAKPYIDEVEIAEYTINQQVDDILMSLYFRKETAQEKLERLKQLMKQRKESL